MPAPEDKPVDVSRAAVIRLMEHARERMNAAIHDSSRWAEATFWDGYCRACEQIIEMENE